MVRKSFYIINAYGWHWSEVTADRLLLIDGDGNVVDGQGEVEASARNIHIASHRANPRHKAIFHVHMPYATSISMIQGGRLLMAHQTAARFYGRIGYEEEFGGIAVTAEEGERLAQQAKNNAHIDCMFLSNHGVVCSGPSIAQAFDDLYYLERAGPPAGAGAIHRIAAAADPRTNGRIDSQTIPTGFRSLRGQAF